MADLRNAILATLAYYEIFDYPLTLAEIYRFLINPTRVAGSQGSVGDITLEQVLRELDYLVRTDAIILHNGFYFLSREKRDNYNIRIVREKTAALKFKKLLKAGRWLLAVPYLRGLFVSGSLALANSNGGGDFDVMVVVRSGRLYTCRIFLSLVAGILGMRRTRYEKTAPDKFCFNHWITTGGLDMKYQSIFTAQSYCAMIPIWGRGDIISSFYAHNLWLNRYVYNFRSDKNYLDRSIGGSPLLIAAARSGEFVLDSLIGSWIEKILKYWQQKRIRENPVTYQKGGRIVFNERELEFHPHSFEAVVVASYNEKLKKLSIAPTILEKDSGLSV